MWRRIKRAIIVLGLSLLKLAILAIIGLAIWRLIKWLPDSSKPLVGTLIGWILGLSTPLIAERAKNIYESKLLAKLLLAEVYANRRLVAGYVALNARPGYDGGYSIRPLVPGYLSTTVFSATLNRQGIFPQNLLSALHVYYNHVRTIDRLHTAYDSARYGDDMAKQLFDLSISEARQASSSGSVLIETLQYESHRVLFQPVWKYRRK